MKRTLRVVGIVIALALTATADVGLFARGSQAQAPGSEGEAAVVIGAVRCFVIRRPEGSLSPADRVEKIQNAFAKYLGQSVATFTTRAQPKSAMVQILMNGEPVVNVTVNDATATGYKKADDLAQVWKKALHSAFQATHVLPQSQKR